ncbi:required to maintain repression 1 [Striga asiatica]|uniref:Required to maintain repression 1 n=1 Tax=Striga asiatica TaxID=4170 RepID=A0A5A7NXI9_STRAF|nr:required to maintain repression 1 [Striga asiatica]
MAEERDRGETCGLSWRSRNKRIFVAGEVAAESDTSSPISPFPEPFGSSPFVHFADTRLTDFLPVLFAASWNFMKLLHEGEGANIQPVHPTARAHKGSAERNLTGGPSFWWAEGKEILQMQGKLDQKHRQIFIKLFNEKQNESKFSAPNLTYAFMPLESASEQEGEGSDPVPKFVEVVHRMYGELRGNSDYTKS